MVLRWIIKLVMGLEVSAECSGSSESVSERVVISLYGSGQERGTRVNVLCIRVVTCTINSVGYCKHNESICTGRGTLSC